MQNIILILLIELLIIAAFFIGYITGSKAEKPKRHTSIPVPATEKEKAKAKGYLNDLSELMHFDGYKHSDD